MVSISSALSWPEMLDAVIKAGHTRIPVYGRSRDDIVGTLYTKDLLRELAKPPQDRIDPWTKMLREAMFVPETKPIDTLLQELQRSRSHLAVVLDEYGGVSGLVTMEDVLEEIVGEIVDEYDTALVDGIREVQPGVFEISGRVHIDEINTSGSIYNCPRTPTTTRSVASSSANWAMCRLPARSFPGKTFASPSWKQPVAGSNACGSKCSTWSRRLSDRVTLNLQSRGTEDLSADDAG